MDQTKQSVTSLEHNLKRSSASHNRQQKEVQKAITGAKALRNQIKTLEIKVEKQRKALSQTEEEVKQLIALFVNYILFLRLRLKMISSDGFINSETTCVFFRETAFDYLLLCTKNVKHSWNHLMSMSNVYLSIGLCYSF